MGTRSTLAWDQQGNRINLGLRSHWDKNNTCTRTSGAREQHVHENNMCMRTTCALEQHVHENNTCTRTTHAQEQHVHGIRMNMSTRSTHASVAVTQLKVDLKAKVGHVLVQVTRHFLMETAG